MKIIYHKNCADGFCAAWLLHKVYPDAEFISAQYGEKPPDVKSECVIIADFSYDRETMQQLVRDTANIRIFDHHVTAREALLDISGCTFDMNRSGAKLVYENLLDSYDMGILKFDVTPYAKLVEYVQDRDLWKFVLPGSKAINAAIGSYNFSFYEWDILGKLFSEFKEEILETEGYAILRWQQKVIDTLTFKPQVVGFEGYKVPLINTSVLMSEIGEKLNETYPFSITYFDKDGERIYSLRSPKDGVDVSEIAKKYGGGGHKSAAGFKTKLKESQIP